MSRPASLARRMTLGFLLAYVVVLLVAMVLLRVPMIQQDEDNHLGTDIAVTLARNAVVPTASGGIAFARDARLSELAARNPDLWLVADVSGKRASFGKPPGSALAFAASLPQGLSWGEFRLADLPRPYADGSFNSYDTAAGRARIIAGGMDPAAISWRGWLSYLAASYMILIVPFVAALALPAVLLVVPLVLRVLDPLVRAAGELDPAKLDGRLPETSVRELSPLIRAFNAALDRLAHAFEQRRRFIADVAHELRTPLAVLGLKVDALPGSAAKFDIQRSVFRLERLVGQMLDAERLTLAARRPVPIDLVALARAAVAEIAPLAIDSGYELAVSAEAKTVEAEGDPHALSRALSNLLANAVAHGGGSGTVEVHVRRDRTIEVTDYGPGIAPDARDRIFEPFSRERWDRDGCGLGLHLVREIMRAHGGDVRLADTASGATFCLTLP